MNDNSVLERAVKWALSDDTGMSSKTLCAHMLGIDVVRPMPPSDASDRRRCIILLEQIPEWIPRLKELADTKPHTSMVFSSAGFHNETNGWAEQIPLIMQEGGFHD